MEFKKSRPIVISDYNPNWKVDFLNIAKDLRETLGSLALRVDHIGSTSVPNLAAKDIIDIQITVTDINNSSIIEKLLDSKYQVKKNIVYDAFVGIEDEFDKDLQKLFSNGKVNERKTNIHIRELGRFNQRFPLLFRDYLRHSDIIRNGYQQIKLGLADIFPDSIYGYLYIKDPVMDIIYEGAEIWAKSINWIPDNNYI